jgi:hypothetical protein
VDRATVMEQDTNGGATKRNGQATQKHEKLACVDSNPPWWKRRGEINSNERVMSSNHQCLFIVGWITKFNSFCIFNFLNSNGKNLTSSTNS